MLLWLVDYSEDTDDVQENISELIRSTSNTLSVKFPDDKLDSFRDDTFPIVENEEKQKFQQIL